MRSSASLLLFLLLSQGAPAAPQSAPSGNQIDEAVAAIPGFDPAHISRQSDGAEFLRRVMLDLVGYPPNAGEITAFLSDPAAGKRTKKIDELLATPRFADFWARRFAEVYFGNYHEPVFNLPEGLQVDTRRRILRSFIDWLKDSIHRDRPWNDIVSDMISARGNSAAVPELGYKLSFYHDERQELNFASGVGRHHLGLSLICARCHDHPQDRLTCEDFLGLAAFNTRQRVRKMIVAGEEQVVVSYVEEGEFDVQAEELGIGKKSSDARGLFRVQPALLGEKGPKEGDRMKALAQLLPEVRHQQVQQALVNRVWSWLLGQGVVEPVDDMIAKHKPVSGELLDALVRTRRDGNGSLKVLLRAICASQSYQRSSESPGTCEKRHFCRGMVRPLTGEQLLNSVQVALRGSPGLDLQEAQHLTAALTTRPQVGCEVQPLPCGTLHALMFRNSGQIWSWIKTSAVLAGIRKQATTDAEVVELMFLAALSRRPGAAEQARFRDFIHDRGDNGIADACWTLINTTEFLTIH
jgi:hypothetical protein